MENSKGSIWKNSLNYGLMTGLVLVIYSLVLYVFDLNLNKALGWVTILISIAGMFIGTKALRDIKQNGALSYGRGLGSGVLISTIAGIIVGIYTYILMTYIDTDILKNVYIQMEEQMLEQGLPDNQIEMAMNMSKKFTTPTMMAIMSPLSYAFWGLLASLVTSAILKKKIDPFASTMIDVEEETEEN